MPSTETTFRFAGMFLTLIASVLFQTSQDAKASSHESCRAVPANHHTVIVCKTNFYKLNVADKIDGKHLEITGYLHKSTDGYYLYASKDAYIYSGGRGGVYLEIDSEQERGLEAEFANYEGAVTVVGLFTRGQGRGAPESIGRIKVLKSMFWRQEFPGEKPRLPIK